MTFTDEFTFTSMQLVSTFYMMLQFVGSLINTHDDDDVKVIKIHQDYPEL